VFVLISAKEWILDAHVSPLWLAVRVLGCGTMGAIVWAVIGTGGSMKNMEVSIGWCPIIWDVSYVCIQWSTLGGASFLIVVQQIAVYTMLQRMSAVR
jgi:hypothetical protein